MRKALFACGVVLLAAMAPAHARKASVTLDDIRQAVNAQWSGVRDLAVMDRATYVHYNTRVGFIPVPRENGAANLERPNLWRIAPGLEYLEVWQGGKYAVVAYDGTVTRSQGRRNSFENVRGRIRPGNDVPVDDLSFAYYVGRLGRHTGLPEFLRMDSTRLVKADTRVGEIPTHRVAGLCDVNLDGTVRRYEVTMDLAPDYGWLPVRTRLTDAETRLLVREYRVSAFFRPNGFAFPKEAQIDLYQAATGRSPGAKPRARLTGSLEYTVEQVHTNTGVGPGDFVLNFSPGIEISDECTGKVYRTPGEEP